jgi:hypothetical protein
LPGRKLRTETVSFLVEQEQRVIAG